eukprot:4300433-Amphidinium_carterae.1
MKRASEEERKQPAAKAKPHGLSDDPIEPVDVDDDDEMYRGVAVPPAPMNAPDGLNTSMVSSGGGGITLLDLFREIRDSREAVQHDISAHVKKIEKRMDKQDGRLSRVEEDVKDIRRVAEEAKHAAERATTTSQAAKGASKKGKGKGEQPESGQPALLELKRWPKNTPAATIKEEAQRYLTQLAVQEPTIKYEEVFVPFARCSLCHIRVSSQEAGWTIIMATKKAAIPLREGPAVVSWQAPVEVRKFRGRIAMTCDAIRASLAELGAEPANLEPCWKSGQIWTSPTSPYWAAKVDKQSFSISFNADGLAALDAHLTEAVVQKHLDSLDSLHALVHLLPKWHIVFLQETSAIPPEVTAIDHHFLIHTTTSARPTALLVHASVAHMVVQTYTSPFPCAVFQANALRFAAISCYLPHIGHPYEDWSDQLAALESMVEKLPPCLVGLDANASLGLEHLNDDEAMRSAHFEAFATSSSLRILNDITIPTHRHKSTGALTCKDFILVSASIAAQALSCSVTHEQYQPSDHFCLAADFAARATHRKRTPALARGWTPLDPAAFKADAYRCLPHSTNLD